MSPFVLLQFGIARRPIWRGALRSGLPFHAFEPVPGHASRSSSEAGATLLRIAPEGKVVVAWILWTSAPTEVRHDREISLGVDRSRIPRGPGSLVRDGRGCRQNQGGPGDQTGRAGC